MPKPKTPIQKCSLPIIKPQTPTPNTKVGGISYIGVLTVAFRPDTEIHSMYEYFKGPIPRIKQLCNEHIRQITAIDSLQNSLTEGYGAYSVFVGFCLIVNYGAGSTSNPHLCTYEQNKSLQTLLLIRKTSAPAKLCFPNSHY